MKKISLHLPALKGLHLPNIISRRQHIGNSRHNIAYKTDANDDDDDAPLFQKLNEIKTALDKNLTEKQKKGFEEVNAKVSKMEEKVSSMEDAAQKNQEAIDKFFTQSNNQSTGQIKTYREVIAREMENRFDDIQRFAKKDIKSLRLDLKVVGDMFSSGNLTGDPVASYSQRQGLVPAQRINIRDLIPGIISPTGLYVHYRETGGEGSITAVTETSAKPQVDYDFTEVKTVSGYIAGFARFSKTMLQNLPWLQSTLVRMLFRDFYKKENEIFAQTIVDNADGFNTTVETDDAKALIDVLMGRLDEDYNNSFILVKNTQKGRILKLLYQNGYYAGSGSVVGTPDGTIRVADTPVIGASWVPDDKAIIIDSDFIERVETDGLRVEFSYEDASNFTENKVTARIECSEELNALRWDAHSVLDLGNESGS